MGTKLLLALYALPIYALKFFCIAASQIYFTSYYQAQIHWEVKSDGGRLVLGLREHPIQLTEKYFNSTPPARHPYYGSRNELKPNDNRPLHIIYTISPLKRFSGRRG